MIDIDAVNGDTDEFLPTWRRLVPGTPTLRPVELGALSHQGRVRPNNEDHYLVARLSRSFESLMTNVPDGDVPKQVQESGYGMLVADGMGGMAAGEVASRLAIQTLVQIVLEVPNWILLVDDLSTPELTARVSEYFQEIDLEVSKQQATDPSLAGMGTTMTLAYSLGAEAFVGHVGDSRAYLFRDGNTQQLTQDHTHVQRLISAGAISRQQAATHRLRGVLTQAIGGQSGQLRVEVHRLQLREEDRLLLCTDGLTDMVPESAIGEALARASSAQQICQHLVDLALEAGGRDNVSVCLAHYGTLVK
jgi:serine/threonine protein phosphatase PrpC